MMGQPIQQDHLILHETPRFLPPAILAAYIKRHSFMVQGRVKLLKIKVTETRTRLILSLFDNCGFYAMSRVLFKAKSQPEQYHIVLRLDCIYCGFATELNQSKIHLYLGAAAAQGSVLTRSIKRTCHPNNSFLISVSHVSHCRPA